MDTCPGCGGPKYSVAKTCQPCFVASRRPVALSRLVCPDCGGVKTRNSVRCKPCSARQQIVIHTCPSCGGPMNQRSKLCQTCYEADFESPDAPFPMSGHEAKKYGAIVTLENADGRVLVLHRVGRVGDAIKEAFEDATRLDETFRIVTISTPSSVYTDMQGSRSASGGGYGGKAILPEQRYASMVHPRVLVAA